MREHRRIAAFRYRFLDIGVLFVWCGFARICSFLMMRHCSRKRPNARSEVRDLEVAQRPRWARRLSDSTRFHDGQSRRLAGWPCA
jgi:hypothetical protein